MAHDVHARRGGHLRRQRERHQRVDHGERGRSRQWPKPVLTRIDSTSSTHIAVLSELVPAVVGTAISGLSWRRGARPWPVAGSTYSTAAVVGGQQVHRLGRVDGRPAADRDEPVHGPCSRAYPAALSMLSSVGLTWTPSNISKLIPYLASESAIRAGMPSSLILGR